MRVKDLLDIPVVWAIFRRVLDLTFGVNRQRKTLLREWGVNNGTVLDVACGIGQFSDATVHGYLGVDLNCDYIRRARRLHGAPNIEFDCVDVRDLVNQSGRFDTVLLIGILHHLDEQTTRGLLDTCRRLAIKRIVVMEVIQQQTNAFGRWIKNNDRGEYVRLLDDLNRLVTDAGFGKDDERVLYLGPTRTIATLWRPLETNKVIG